MFGDKQSEIIPEVSSHMSEGLTKTSVCPWGAEIMERMECVAFDKELTLYYLNFSHVKALLWWKIIYLKIHSLIYEVRYDDSIESLS